MTRLGFIWYGQLVDAMVAAGLRCDYNQAREELMVREVISLLRDRV
jgi:hypothetical protein